MFGVDRVEHQVAPELPNRRVYGDAEPAELTSRRWSSPPSMASIHRVDPDPARRLVTAQVLDPSSGQRPAEVVACTRLLRVA